MTATVKGNVDSSNYLEHFNRIAKAADEDFVWIKDDNNPFQVDKGEIKVPKDKALKYGLNSSDFKGDTVWVLSPLLKERIEAVQDSIEVARRSGVREALDVKNLVPVISSFDVKGLSRPSQKALPHFARISRLTDELKMLMLDPRILEFEKVAQEEAAKGYTASAQLFLIQGEMGCGPYVSEPACDIVPTLPRLDPNTILWPDDFTEEELKRLEAAKDPNFELLLSYYTAVERDGNGGYRAIPYNQHPVFKSRLIEIADEFDIIAGIPGIHESIKKTAEAYSKAIRIGTPLSVNHYNPFEDAEAVWASNFGGDLGFTWGPFEEDDPFSKKRGFQFMLFAPRQDLMGKLREYQGYLQEVENATAQKVLGYKARPMAFDAVLHVSDVLMRAGDMRHSGGEYLAHVLPNDGPLVDQGKPRREIFANIHGGKGTYIMKRLAEEGLDPQQVDLFDANMFMVESAVHELVHTAGPRAETEVTLADGSKITARTKMGAGLFSAIEESKANIGGIYLYQYLLAHKAMTKRDVEIGYVTYVVNLMRQVRFGKSSPHGRGAKAELGYLFVNDAVTIIRRGAKGEPRIHVNLDKMPSVVEKMYVAVTTVQQYGGKELAEAFFTSSASIPGDIDIMAKRYAEATPPIPRDITLAVSFTNDPFDLRAIVEGRKQ